MLGSSSRCLSEREMLLSSNRFERAVFGYVVLFVVVIGVTGNVLNFTVLLAPPMRSRSWLLSALAVCDIFFLLFMLPHSLAHYELFAFNYTFRNLYLSYKINLLAFTNWASAAAIWMILFICFERLIAVRYPLMIRRYPTDSALFRRTLIIFVVMMTGFLTVYRHFSYVTIMKPFCNNTQIYAFHIPVGAAVWPGNKTNPNSYWLRKLISWNTRIHELFVVFIPTITIIIANVMLLLTLRARGRNKYLSSVRGPSTENAGTPITKAEQNVTYTVCAIVTCFTLTQAPSGIVSAKIGFLEFKSPIWQRNVMVITNSMVVVGKSLNFLLFCLSSATFRRRLIVLIKSKFGAGINTMLPTGSSRRISSSAAEKLQSFQNRTQNGSSAGRRRVQLQRSTRLRSETFEWVSKPLKVKPPRSLSEEQHGSLL